VTGVQTCALPISLDYLLKPIDREELQVAVRKAVHRLQNPLPQQLQILLQKLHQPPHQVNQIALPTMEGLQLVPLESIISCASSSNYTIISLKENQKITVSRTLKEIEEMLEDYLFMRVHHSYLVNLNEIRKYIKGEGGNLIMSDGSGIDVSRSKKEQLLKKLQPRKYE
jgi:two-component system LytT family response regulator